MPDLSYESVQVFWHSYNPALFAIISSMEAAEGSKPMSEELEQRLIDFGNVLDSYEAAPPIEPEEIVKLVIAVPFSQALRALHFLESRSPGYVSNLILWTEDHDKEGAAASAVKYFVQRNLVFDRLQIMARVFHKSRLSLLDNALEVVDEQA